VNKPIPFGKYYLLERINVGGMAEVYRAKAYGVEGFERLVAVKRILPNVAEDKEFIKMFVDEAKLAVQLNHANIAQIFDLGMVGSDYYIALEHIHGRDLRATFERCREQGQPMPIAQACFCVMKVCEGLDYAHNKRDAAGHELGLVHRDVSPQNVLVSFEGEVKLIDFGIAKAAGRGSQTEAGILKGKFGYMSPEQVRGLPIDRRSDVFSCGIVLYEMLTGERLFVGESDFSTLEKVRNVEILPPSTYNRKIPDELERIVLKALAKDVEDRYQNAIDLHDELQAFVYTAGEFYSRKDLAGWMKKTFTKEIEVEKAKLEQYRQFSPDMAQQQRAARPSTPPPPPLPGRRPSARASVPPPIPGAVRPPQVGEQMVARGAGNLDWDDEELETSIYDGPQSQGETLKDSPRPIAAAAGLEAATGSEDQDLAGLVRKARDWNSQEPGPPQPPEKTANGSGPKIAVPPATMESIPAGPEKLRAARGSSAPPALADEALPIPVATPRDSSAVAALAAMAERQRSTYEGPTVDLMERPFAEGRGTLIAALAGGGLLLVGGIVAVVLLLGGGDEAPAKAGARAVAEVVDPSVLKDTGFDLVVRPSGLDAEVRLDGKSMGKAPLRFRNIQPGEHNVEVIAPEGFFNQVQKVEIGAGKAPRITVELDSVPRALELRTEPAGALAVLIGPDGSRQELGSTPATAKVDVYKSYKVEVSLAGYATKVEELALGKDVTELAVIALDKVEDEAPAPAVEAEEHKVERHREPKSERPASVRASSGRSSREDEATAALERAALEREAAKAKEEPAAKPVEPKKEEVERPEPKPASSAKGTLLVGSKPPCEIYIDGRNTGLKTPQRDIALTEGKHKVVLVNNEHGIRDSFIVKIEEGKRTKVIRDLLDKMQ